MADITLNPDSLKEILKSAIVELMSENRAEVSNFMAEVMEDIAMERAIEEGSKTELVSRDAIFQILEPRG